MSDTDKSKGQQDPKRKKLKVKTTSQNPETNVGMTAPRNQILTENVSTSRAMFFKYLLKAETAHNTTKQ